MKIFIRLFNWLFKFTGKEIVQVYGYQVAWGICINGYLYTGLRYIKAENVEQAKQKFLEIFPARTVHGVFDWPYDLYT